MNRLCPVDQRRSRPVAPPSAAAGYCWSWSCCCWYCCCALGCGHSAGLPSALVDCVQGIGTRAHISGRCSVYAGMRMQEARTTQPYIEACACRRPKGPKHARCLSGKGGTRVRLPRLHWVLGQHVARCRGASAQAAVGSTNSGQQASGEWCHSRYQGNPASHRSRTRCTGACVPQGKARALTLPSLPLGGPRVVRRGSPAWCQGKGATRALVLVSTSLGAHCSCISQWL